MKKKKENLAIESFLQSVVSTSGIPRTGLTFELLIMLVPETPLFLPPLQTGVSLCSPSYLAVLEFTVETRVALSS